MTTASNSAQAEIIFGAALLFVAVAEALIVIGLRQRAAFIAQQLRLAIAAEDELWSALGRSESRNALHHGSPVADAEKGRYSEGDAAQVVDQSVRRLLAIQYALLETGENDKAWFVSNRIRSALIEAGAWPSGR